MEYPTWPLGTRFKDRDGRVFEVHHVIMGNPDEGLSWELETYQGWKITSSAISSPQTKVGFVELGKLDAEIIYQCASKLTEFVTNRHLIRL